MAIGIGRIQTVLFGQDHGLNDREALGCTILQIKVRLRTIKTMEQFPGRIAQVEEGLAG